MLSKGFDGDAVSAAIGELASTRAIDDARYAHHYVAYQAGRGRGPIRIAADLRKNGIAAELIEAAVAEGPDWTTIAARVRRARFGAKAPASWSERARQARFLQYRGFSSDHTRAVTGVDPDTGSSDP